MGNSVYQLKRGDIRDCTDPGSYTRGLRYFQQDRVKSVAVETFGNNDIVLRAMVWGSGSHLYEQEIHLYGLATDATIKDIDGRCSCPVGFNCKHVVAACLQFQAHPGASDRNSSSSCMAWLDDFVHSTGPPAVGDTGAEFIAYILHPSSEPGTLSVRFQVTRYLKNGGLSKGREAALYSFSDEYQSPRYAQEIDREIGRLIRAQGVNYWDRQPLAGELGFLSLQKILSTGRCFWQSISSPPLRPDVARELRLDWRVDSNGDAHLQIGVQPDAELLRTVPPLYLDTQSGGIGPLHGDAFSGGQWAMLLSAPTVPASAVTEFSRRLLTQLPGAPLPPPRALETVDVEPGPPVPRLHLFGDVDEAGRRFHMMRLRVAYQDYEISLLPQEPLCSVSRHEAIVRVQRDLPAEAAALATLEALGFSAMLDRASGDVVLISPGETGVMDSAARWQHFLGHVLPELEAQGWQVEIDSSFQLRFLQVADWQVEIEPDREWFELRFDLDIDGRKLPLLPLIAELLSNYDPQTLPEILTLPLGDHQYLSLPAERIRPVCEVLYELYDSQTLDSDGALRMRRFDAARLAELETDYGADLRWQGGKALRELGRKLKTFQGVDEVTAPRGLRTSLRGYQQQGLNWLQFLRAYAFGGILADDMGLGKTVQTLAHLLLEKQQGRLDKPGLIIAPTSLMSNWRREAEQFTPDLKVLVLQGPDRRQRFAEIPRHDLVLSTYPLLLRDEEALLAQDYHYLVLDEAQNIKNPRARAAKLVRRIRTRHRLCLTGTPMENHLGELWALFDVILPGLLGDAASFKRRFRTPIEKYGDQEQHRRLVSRVAPFMLRRTKAEVIKELPAKTEIIRSVPLESKQAALYESIRLSMEKRVRDTIASKGLARSHITVLDALLKLRQTCCDPGLLPLAQAKKVQESAKLTMLMEMLPELIEEGRRILLFSQFARMLGIIEDRLKTAGIACTKLTGQTRKRDDAIACFRRGEAAVFLISLKAGGVGLNLTEADTVIHYDPWWNPAVENQATDRAHRIGQDKAVFVYKLVTENTVEAKILALQAKKHALAEGVYSRSQQGADLKLSAQDLQELFAPL